MCYRRMILNRTPLVSRSLKLTGKDENAPKSLPKGSHLRWLEHKHIELKEVWRNHLIRPLACGPHTRWVHFPLQAQKHSKLWSKKNLSTREWSFVSRLMYNTLESWGESMFTFPTGTTSEVSDANNPRILWWCALSLQPNFGIQRRRLVISNLFTPKDLFLYYFSPVSPTFRKICIW